MVDPTNEQEDDKPTNEQETEPEGVRCPRCNCAVSRVAWVRRKTSVNRRARICGYCGHRYSTREEVVGGKKDAKKTDGKK